MSQEGLPASSELRVFDDVLGTIGRTPLVRLSRVTRGLSCPIYAKLEFFNPGGSVKDRIGYRIIEAYERSGELKPGGTVVESTSGNTGVGLAIACARKGYRAVFVMPDKMSQEKVQLLRAFGAKVVITPTAVLPEDPRSYYSVARRIVSETPNAVLANQYHNPANPESHYLTTGPEIWEQTQGRVTDLVIGMGTGGTITGVARYMREHGHRVRITGVDPAGSLLYDAWRQGGSVEGLEAYSYKIEGIGEDFIPSTLDLSLVDEVVQVDDAEAFHWTRRLVREEGIFCGGSSGAAMAGAARIAEPLGPDRLVVVLLPDSGSRYLSKIFNDEWMRENRLLDEAGGEVPALSVARARGLRRLITARPDESVSEVIDAMRVNGVSQLPMVGADGLLQGLVSEVDLMQALLELGEAGAGRPVADFATADVCTAAADAPFEGVLPQLLARRVVVLQDELRQPVGILTLIDALEYLASAKHA